MILLKAMFEDFKGFLEVSYGCTVTVRDDSVVERVAEKARFMIGERLFVIRPLGTESYDVVSGDKERLDQLELLWAQYTSVLIRESMKDGTEESTNPPADQGGVHSP